MEAVVHVGTGVDGEVSRDSVVLLFSVRDEGVGIAHAGVYAPCTDHFTLPVPCHSVLGTAPAAHAHYAHTALFLSLSLACG